MPKSELAVALAKLSEEATPAVLSAVLEKFWACKICGRAEKIHPKNDCGVWVAGFGMKDGLELLDRLTAFSLHEEKVEDALGLNKKAVGEMIPWLVGVDIQRFKRATVVEKERMLLTAMEGGQVVDVEPVKGPSS